MASSSKKSANLLGKRNPGDDLKTFPVLKKHKEHTAKGFVDHVNLIPVKEVVFVSNLSPQSQISDILGFFKDVGKVVRVQLIVNHEGNHVGHGFVQFASSDEAKKALQMKNGQYLLTHKILLAESKETSTAEKKFSIDHKVWYEEDYIQRESLNEAVEGPQETPDFVEKVLFVANLSPQTEIFHLIDFFKDVEKVDRIRLVVNHESKHVGYAFVQFFSANEAKKALEKKNHEYLHDHKIFLDVAKAAPYTPQPKYNLANKLCYEDYLRRESFLLEEDETVEGLDKTPDFFEAVAIKKKSLIVANLPGETEISDIINFFKDVGEVVHVRRMLTVKGKYIPFSFVEFASAKEAKKALKKKNGEYLYDHKIRLEMSKETALPRYCLDHKVWYEDYLRREGLLIQEDEAVEGLDDFVEAVSVQNKTLFVANLPCQTEISNIIHFFKDVGQVVHIQLIVNLTGKHVGCCFVEFATAKEAEKALEMKNYHHNCKMFLDVVKTAPYPLQPKFNLAEDLWYEEDYIQRESLLIEEDEAVEGLDETPDVVEAVPVRERMLFIANLPFGTEISEIIDFFKDVGEVVHVRLIVTSKGDHVDYGFVEFASANEAKKALETKNGEYIQDHDILLEMPCGHPHKFCMNHKVWYREDYLLKKPMMENPKKSIMEEFCGKKISFSCDGA